MVKAQAGLTGQRELSRTEWGGATPESRSARIAVLPRTGQRLARLPALSHRRTPRLQSLESSSRRARTSLHCEHHG